MSIYSEFFLNSKQNIVQLELLQISHPNFTKTYNIVRNHVKGVTVTLETAAQATFDYYPVSIEAGGDLDDLDHSLNITFGDLGEILPAELDAVSTAGGMETKPTITYRTYRSDQLTSPLFGPVVLEAESFSFKREGCTFVAKVPQLNLNGTGEIYSLERFPALRNVL